MILAYSTFIPFCLSGSIEQREMVHRRLLVKFPKTDLNTRPIRNAAAVATNS